MAFCLAHIVCVVMCILFNVFVRERQGHSEEREREGESKKGSKSRSMREGEMI